MSRNKCIRCGGTGFTPMGTKCTNCNTKKVKKENCSNCSGSGLIYGGMRCTKCK